jgi:hypothetical protein
MTDWYCAENFPIPKGEEVIIKGIVSASVKIKWCNELLIKPSAWKYAKEKEPEKKGDKENDFRS